MFIVAPVTGFRAWVDVGAGGCFPHGSIASFQGSAYVV